eukprot:TRINITY_DN372_c1_g2_i4.p2 TRINITY_DN372_c1_g2~~TRINITY_DN372_c1_g2_i4.p2  ORF type:complete len:226 (+),score=56.61 TRINITY_DN372_c1_g2_i4:89-679(+)
MVKKDGYKKKSEYEVVISPKCECEGTYILNADYCPSCESALAALLSCAQAEAREVVEIPAKCLTEVGVTVEYLKACGFVQEETKVEEATVQPAAKKYEVAPEAAPAPSSTPKKNTFVQPEAARAPSPTPKKYTVVQPEAAPAPSPAPKKYTVVQPEVAPAPSPKSKRYVVPEATPVPTSKTATATATATATMTKGN